MTIKVIIKNILKKKTNKKPTIQTKKNKQTNRNKTSDF